MNGMQAEHAHLISAARTAIELTAALQQRLISGEVHHMQHSDMADRARALALHLDAAANLAHSNAYPSAFAVLRIALEHQLIDDLVFRGRRLIQLVSAVTQDQWARWQQDRVDGAGWTRDIREWSISRTGNVRIVREGMFSEEYENGHRWAISVYYFLIQQYDALARRPSEALAPAPGFPLAPEMAVRHAKDNQALYETYLKWASIRANLIGNGFETETDMARIDVHYRFLSSYVHPVSDRISATYGRNQSWPRYDHYSSELILLYIITLAVREIRSFLTMTKLEPVVGIEDESALRDECDQLWARASHLWFPGQNKQPYDEFVAANRVAFEQYQDQPRTDLHPDSLHYEDPLARIVALHRSTSELTTGRVYNSPWARTDAQRR